VPANTVPLIAVGIAVLLNSGNALLYGSHILLALKDAFIGAGILVGLFAASDTRSNRMQTLVTEVTTASATPKESETESETSAPTQ
jgi:hypothetical protein